MNNMLSDNASGPGVGIGPHPPAPDQRTRDRRTIGAVAMLLASSAVVSFFIIMIAADAVDPQVGFLRLARIILALFICYFAAQGRNWARWWLVVGCSIGILSALFGAWRALQVGNYLPAGYLLLLVALYATSLYILAFSAASARFFPETPDRV
jgi:hypothetical protein